MHRTVISQSKMNNSAAAALPDSAQVGQFVDDFTTILAQNILPGACKWYIHP